MELQLGVFYVCLGVVLGFGVVVVGFGVVVVGFGVVVVGCHRCWCNREIL